MQKVLSPFPTHLSAKGAKVVTLLLLCKFCRRGRETPKKRRWQTGAPPWREQKRDIECESLRACLNCETFLASPNGAEGWSAIKKIIQLFWGAFRWKASCFWWMSLFAAHKKTRSHVTWWSRPRAPAPQRTETVLFWHGALFLVSSALVSHQRAERVSPPNCKRLLRHLVIIYFDHIFTHPSAQRRSRGMFFRGCDIMD